MMKSYKNKFPFQVTVPSWLYPEGYLENVSRVAPYVDGVELLFFEGEAGSLPESSVWEGLLALKEEHGLSYNIHMPIDENLASLDSMERERAIGAHLHLFDLCRVLTPETHTIHLQRPEGASVDRWTSAAKESLGVLADSCDASLFTVETLDDSLFSLAETIESHGFYVCLDLGHLIHYGLPVEETIERFASLCRMVHLHGVAGGKDHRSLTEMDSRLFSLLLPFLSNYSHTLSMEIFKAAPCFESIAFLETVIL